MRSGPCLCGDPYCPSCGNPAEAAFQDAIDEFLDELREQIETHDELLFIKETSLAMVSAYKRARTTLMHEIGASMQEAVLESQAEYDQHLELIDAYPFQNQEHIFPEEGEEK